MADVAAGHEVWRAAAWYRGLSLTERGAPAEAAARHFDTERATRRLRTWKAQKPFEHEPLLEKRLALDSLSAKDLLAILAEPADFLKDRIPRYPQWLAALRKSYTGADPDQKLLNTLHEIEIEHPLAEWLPALAPLFEHFLRSLMGDLKEIRQKFGSELLDAETLRKIFQRNIAPAVLYQISKPLILEMHIARLRGNLEGDTPQARFEHFLHQHDQRGFVDSFLVRYPVLARQLVVTVEQWTAYLSEFMAHLHADWHAIRDVFTAADGDPGPLVDLDAGKGDRHRGGRSVLLVTFGSGMRLLYKPKPLAVDAHFQELLSWLNDRGAEPRFQPLTLIDRGKYGWSAFVAVSPCASETEVARFYERQGSFLAVLYALCAADFHNENLIAAGEHPVLVDLEALFHPHVHAGDPVLTENPAAGALDESVWQVGILPRRIWAGEDSLGVDMSGLGGQAGQTNPHPLISWEEQGSDEMRLDRRLADLPAAENRPWLADKDVNVLDYQDEIVAGFTRMYRLLRRHREELLAEWLPRFARDEIRVVIRSTNVYGLLWYESFHPDVLRDALDRDRFFDRLWAEVPQRPHLARVIRAEQHDLRRGDIPVFTTYPDSRTIFTSDGEGVPGFLDTPSLDLVRQRLYRLGEDDLGRQIWIIEASLATLRMDREDAIGRPPACRPVGRPVTRAQLLELADAAGGRLGELAFQNENGAYWLGVGPLDESAWGLFPAGSDLYAGTPGITLFLAYLGAVTGRKSHTVLAHRALESVRVHVGAWLEARREEAASLSVGAFDGVGSVIYLLTNLGVLWADASLLAEAEGLVERLSPLIAGDERLDIIYGSAGCALSLLALHAVRPAPRTLEVAIRCGDRLLATVQPAAQGANWTTLSGQPPLGGFSHGTAGIALSLLKLADASGAERFRAAGIEGLKYDRSLFVPELGNWADLRVFPGRDNPDHKSMVAWCHGAPGIGLARLAALHQLDDPTTRAEIDRALSITTRYGFMMNHSLCHGALGNADFVLTAARMLNRPGDNAALEGATEQIVASLGANGPVTGVPLGVETPGLMTGLAGIGYELLRLAEPDNVPSVLLLAPPTMSGTG
ncbi:type 2 lanthipeptide synthetase LanM family protein [Amycolatopsis pithecellobii]|nr:type 2 lanthipeptide synthetase LanM family protein [Amycolatopsis pithecellobii]